MVNCDVFFLYGFLIECYFRKKVWNKLINLLRNNFHRFFSLKNVFVDRRIFISKLNKISIFAEYKNKHRVYVSNLINSFVCMCSLNKIHQIEMLGEYSQWREKLFSKKKVETHTVKYEKKAQPKRNYCNDIHHTG